MLNHAKSTAPEPAYSAYLYLLYWVAVFVRNYARQEDRFSRDQLFDLMDAIHNVPEIIRSYDNFEGGSKEFNSIFFDPYDEKWAKGPNDLSLNQTFERAIQELKKS